MFMRSPAPTTPTEVRAAVIEGLEEALIRHRVTVRDDDMFALAVTAKDDPDEVLIVNLHNLVAQVLGPACPPAEAREAIARFVRMVEVGAAPPKVTLDRIYPAFRPCEAITGDPDVRPEDDALISKGPGDLWLVMLADLGDGLMTVNEAAAERSGLTVDDVIAAAEENLRRIAPRVFMADQEDGVAPVGIQGFPWLGASLLLVPGFLRAIADGEGWKRPMVAAPGKEVVGLVDGTTEEGRQALARWMAREADLSAVQSETVFGIGECGALSPVMRMYEGRLVTLS